MKNEKNHDKYNEILKTISTKLSKLKEDEIQIFFKAFLTPSEILELCDRYLIVENLVNNKTQRAIASQIGVSISKITSGSRELKFGFGKEIFKKFINLALILTFSLISLNSFAKHECSKSEVFNKVCKKEFGSLLEVVACVKSNKAALQSGSDADNLCFEKTNNVFNLCPYGILESCGSVFDKDRYEECIAETAEKQGIIACAEEISKYIN